MRRIMKQLSSVSNTNSSARSLVVKHMPPISHTEQIMNTGFDYLRDNLAVRKEDLAQRGHAYAIVDEIDSILIDEARTPLIISSESTESDSLYVQFADIARNLERETDFTVDEKQRAIQLTDMGITKAESLLGIENIYTEKRN
jgi:preprotein translocase subunit SecA